jgi:hypothetical protein
MGGVFVAIPCGEQSRYSRFWAEIQSLELPPDSGTCAQFGPFIVNNQNRLAHKFMAGNWDWFFLANDDQLYPPSSVKQMIAHQKEAVVALSVSRKPPHAPLIYDMVEDQFFCHNLKPLENGLIKIVGSGGGGLLLNRSVFEKVEEPWWNIAMMPNGEHGGEDLFFNRKMNNAGIELWCDTTIRVGHMTTFTLTPTQDKDGVWQIGMDRH